MQTTLPPTRHWIPRPPVWWRKAKPLRWGLVVAALAYGGYLWYQKSHQLPVKHPETEVYLARASNALMLIEGFASYDSLASVQAKLSVIPHTRQSRHRQPSADFPPANFDTLTVSQYVDSQVEGTLRLEFFNDRLYEVEFQPSKPENYSGRLHRRYPGLRRDANGKAEYFDRDLRLSTNIDYALTPVGKKLSTVPFIIWQDQRLLQQRDTWEAQYGRLPAALRYINS